MSVLTSSLPLTLQVPVADTVGCGDSFAAAIILGFIRGHSIPETLALANAGEPFELVLAPWPEHPGGAVHAGGCVVGIPGFMWCRVQTRWYIGAHLPSCHK